MGKTTKQHQARTLELNSDSATVWKLQMWFAANVWRRVQQTQHKVKRKMFSCCFSQTKKKCRLVTLPWSAQYTYHANKASGKRKMSTHVWYTKVRKKRIVISYDSLCTFFFFFLHSWVINHVEKLLQPIAWLSWHTLDVRKYIKQKNGFCAQIMSHRKVCVRVMKAEEKTVKEKNETLFCL